MKAPLTVEENTNMEAHANDEPPVYSKASDGALSKNIVRVGMISVDLFFFVPRVSIRRGNVVSGYLNMYPFLYITARASKGLGNTADRKFRLSQRDLPLVLRFFQRVEGWFNDPKLKDLFVLSENDELLFNHSYGMLYETLKLEVPSGVSTMKAIPDVIVRNDKSYAEGIRLMINKNENVASLTYDELYILYKTLEKFDFSSEVASTYLMATTLIRNGKYEFFTNDKN